MLALSSRLHYVHEPFAPMYERAWVRQPTVHRYLHVPIEADTPLAHDLDRIAALRPPWRAMIRRSRRPQNAVRILQEVASARWARAQGASALIKDPFALLLAEWLVERTAANVIVLVRHPAAFASSVKRLGWRLDVRWLLDQPALMRSDLAPFREQLEADCRGQLDLMAHAALVWRALNTVVRRYELEYPDWQVTRYEDLAQAPIEGFRRIFERAGVPWSAAIQRRIEEANASSHGARVPEGSPGGTRRDSQQAMWTWLERLTRGEIDQLHDQTQDVASHWYSEEDWSRPDETEQ
jgi:hypothetical protein